MHTEEIGTTLETYPVFDLDRIVWSEMTPGDFDQEFIGFYRGNSSCTMETKYFKNERGELMLEDADYYFHYSPPGNSRSCNFDCHDADYDSNFFINVNDLLVVMQYYGSCQGTCVLGDLDGDGCVTTADIIIFQAYYGSECP